jgi:hypothetical protein
VEHDRDHAARRSGRLIKIAELATVIPGLAMFVLGTLVFLLAAMAAVFDPRDRLGSASTGSPDRNPAGGAAGVAMNPERDQREVARPAPAARPAGWSRGCRRRPALATARAAASACIFVGRRASSAAGR